MNCNNEFLNNFTLYCINYCRYFDLNNNWENPKTYLVGVRGPFGVVTSLLLDPDGTDGHFLSDFGDVGDLRGTILLGVGDVPLLGEPLTASSDPVRPLLVIIGTICFGLDELCVGPRRCGGPRKLGLDGRTLFWKAAGQTVTSDVVTVKPYCWGHSLKCTKLAWRGDTKASMLYHCKNNLVT